MKQVYISKNKLSLSYVLFLVLALNVGCGSDPFSDYLRSGDTLSSGKRATISIEPKIVVTSCNTILGDEAACFQEKYIYAVLPSSVNFIGSAEATYNLGNLIFNVFNRDLQILVLE